MEGPMISQLAHPKMLHETRLDLKIIEGPPYDGLTPKIQRLRRQSQ